MLASLNARQRSILLFLLRRDTPATAGQLANRYGAAMRTVRYDLEHLRLALKGTGLTMAARPRTGVWIEGLPDRRAAVTALLISEEAAPAPGPIAREDRLLLELLTHDEGLTTVAVSDMLACSRTTVLRDLGGVERRLKTYGLRLERLRGRVQVAGTERDRREALVRFMVETMDPGDLLKTSRDAASKALEPAPAGSLPRGAGWTELTGVVGRAEQALQRKFTDESFVSLVVHLSVTLQRLKAGQAIAMPAARLAELKQLPEWRIATVMAGELESFSGVAIPDAERGYMTLHLVGGRAQPMAGSTESQAGEPADPAAARLAERLIAEVGAKLQVNFTGDKTLREGLTWHLQGLLARQRFQLAATNPLKAEIREQMAPVYAAVAQVVGELRSDLGTSLTEDETGFLTVHVAAALERTGHTAGTRVLVVCSTGLGSAQLLAARLVRFFREVQIVGVVSALETTSANWHHQVDLVISTVPLPPLPVPQVRVSPLLAANEVEQLRRAMRAVAGGIDGEGAEPGGHPLVEGLLSLLPAYADIQDMDGLRRALGEYLVAGRPPLELAEPVVREVALLGIQMDPTAQAGLAIHLQLALPRYRAGQVVQEPDLDRVRREHRSLFRAVERGLELFGRWHGVSIPPEEVVPVLRYIVRPDKES